MTSSSPAAASARSSSSCSCCWWCAADSFPRCAPARRCAACKRLASGGLMKPETGATPGRGLHLPAAVEHRIQFLDDQQTHLLPTVDADLAWIARSLGLRCTDDACELIDRPGGDPRIRRQRVRRAAARRPGPPVASRPGLPQLRQAAGARRRSGLPRTAARTAARAGQALVRPSEDQGPARRQQAAPGPAGGARRQQAREQHCTMDAALHFIDWLEPLLRRESYLALLVERPEVQDRLLRLLGLAKWPMRYLMRHPGVIDELADQRLVHGRFEREGLRRRARRAASRLGAQRPGRRGIAARHPAPGPPCRGLSHPRSRRRGADRCRAGGRRSVRARRRDAQLRAALVLAPPQDGPPARAADGGDRLRQARRQGARLRQRSRRGLRLRRSGRARGRGLRRLRAQADQLADAAHGGRRTVRHRHPALRPNGNSGLLVTSLASFYNYQKGRGSNTAWTWEHQAITRARFCAGWAPLAAGFEAVAACRADGAA